MQSVAMVTSNDNRINALLDAACNSADPYQAAALHPWLSGSQCSACEKIIFTQRRHPRFFAQATYTPASLLQRLALESDSLVLDKLVKNPATPTTVLKRLARNSGSEHRLNAIAAHPNASAALLDSLNQWDSSALRQAVCHNPNTGLLQLNRLLAIATLDECKGMAQNPHADTGLLRKLWQAHDELYLHAEIAAHSNCPAELLNAALTSELALLRCKAATNAKLSDAQVAQLLADGEAQVRAATLRHLEAETIALTDEPARRVRRELARKTGLDEQLIEKLSIDEDAWVRRWVARNPAAPESVLRRLAQDSEAEVRRGVARNPLTPIHLCSQLATDPNSWVRAGIAIRTDLSQAIIKPLSSDDSEDVLAGLGRNSATPAYLLARIAGHRDHDVRRAVILNPQAPFEILRNLLEDPYPFNRARLCRHPALGDDELWQLIDDPEAQVRFSAVQVLAAGCGS
jgi:hypothetical protein